MWLCFLAKLRQLPGEPEQHCIRRGQIGRNIAIISIRKKKLTVQQRRLQDQKQAA